MPRTAARAGGVVGAGAAPHERWPGVTIAIDTAGGRYTFDRAAARDAVEFAAECLGHVWLPWVRDLIVRPTFGWRRVTDGRRRFRRVFLGVPKQNGKSTTCVALAALIAYQHALPGTTVVIVGAAKSQAENTLEPLKRMVRDSPILRPRTEVYARTIVIPERDVKIVVLAADASGAHGYRVAGLALRGTPRRRVARSLRCAVALGGGATGAADPAPHDGGRRPGEPVRGGVGVCGEGARRRDPRRHDAARAVRGHAG